MRFSVDGNVITFDDGGMNLLSSDALQELREVVRQCGAAALRGAGRIAAGGGGAALIFRMTRAAGADMAEMARFTGLEAYDFARLGQEVFAAIERLPCLTIAAIDGDCFGGALDLVMAFDLRFATERSRFSHPGAKLGIVTGFGGTSRWRRVIESAAARKLFLANPILSANEALDIGLIDGIGEPQIPDVDPMTVQFVKELALHGANVGRRELALLADRLGHIYFGNDER
jgi:enoyl-CoA hydratase/carnithine racemase